MAYRRRRTTYRRASAYYRRYRGRGGYREVRKGKGYVTLRGKGGKTVMLPSKPQGSFMKKLVGAASVVGSAALAAWKYRKELMEVATVAAGIAGKARGVAKDISTSSPAGYGYLGRTAVVPGSAVYVPDVSMSSAPAFSLKRKHMSAFGLGSGLP